MTHNLPCGPRNSNSAESIMRRLAIAVIMAFSMMGATAISSTPSSSTSLQNQNANRSSSNRNARKSTNKNSSTASNKNSSTASNKNSSASSNKNSTRSRGNRNKGTTTATGAGNPDAKVWVNTATGVYHCAGTKWYGKTKAGEYMTQREALEKNFHADHGKACQ